jgi:hypothetical protein
MVGGAPAPGSPPRPLGNQRVDFGLRWADEWETRRGVAVLTKRRFAPDPETAPILEWLFKEYDRGASLRGLQKALHERGVMPPGHARTGATFWALGVIRGVLSNEHYTGRGYAGTTRTVRGPNGGRRVERRPREEWVELPAGTYPALIDPALFARVQARIAGAKRESQRRDRDPEVGLLRRGIARCGLCGRTLRVVTDHGEPAYRCTKVDQEPGGCARHSMRAAKLDADVWALVALILEREDLIDQRLAALKEEDPAAPHLPAVEKRLADLERRRANLRKRLGATDDDALATEYQIELKAVLGDVGAAEAQRAALLAQRAAWRAAEDQRAGIKAYAREVREELGQDGEMDFHKKRQALIRLGVEVRLFPTDHKPRWKLRTRWQPHGKPDVWTVFAAVPGGTAEWESDAPEPGGKTRHSVRVTLHKDVDVEDAVGLMGEYIEAMETETVPNVSDGLATTSAPA